MIEQHDINVAALRGYLTLRNKLKPVNLEFVEAIAARVFGQLLVDEVETLERKVIVHLIMQAYGAVDWEGEQLDTDLITDIADEIYSELLHAERRE